MIAPRRIAEYLALFLPHLKRGSDGNLLHGPTGHLVRDCGSSGLCACTSTTGCIHCPDSTPSQFHISFVDVTLCMDCVDCPDAGVSLQFADGAVLNGTYVLTQNGSCAWTASLSASVNFFGSSGCTGSSSSIALGIQLVRVNSTQFLLQVTDDTGTILLFNATVNASQCCASFSADNALTTCGCVIADETTFTLATGGSATVTPC